MKVYTIERRTTKTKTKKYLPDDLEFLECSGEEEYHDYLCISERSLISDFDLEVFPLPLDMYMILIRGVKFSGSPPPMISAQKFNQRLEEIRRKIVWVSSDSSPYYKLVWVDGREEVYIYFIDPITRTIVSDMTTKNIYWLGSKVGSADKTRKYYSQNEI